jgi:hypothetical protein
MNRIIRSFAGTFKESNTRKLRKNVFYLFSKKNKGKILVRNFITNEEKWMDVNENEELSKLGKFTVN